MEYKHTFKNVKLVHVLESMTLIVKENWDSDILKLHPQAFKIKITHS